jgi:hypothetical protein
VAIGSAHLVVLGARHLVAIGSAHLVVLGARHLVGMDRRYS